MKSKKISLIITTIILLITACSKIKTNPDIVYIINKIDKECKITMHYAILNKCRKQKKSFFELQKRIGIEEVLPTLTYFFTNENKRKATIATYFLYYLRSYFSKIVKSPKLVKKSITKNLIVGLKNMTDYQAYYAAIPITNLAMLHGLEEEIFTVASSHPQDTVRNAIYRNAMQYGRLKVFDKIKVASRSKKKHLAFNAIASTQKMFNMTKKERYKVCDWLKTIINRPVERESTEAAKTLVTRCKGEYIDIVLDKLEKLSKVELKKSPMRFILSSYSFYCKKHFSKKSNGTKMQCKRKEILKAKLK